MSISPLSSACNVERLIVPSRPSRERVAVQAEIALTIFGSNLFRGLDIQGVLPRANNNDLELYSLGSFSFTHKVSGCLRYLTVKYF